MGAAIDGMDITDYIENDTQDYMLIHYKVTDDFSEEKYREIFHRLKSKGIMVNDDYDDKEWILKKNDGRKHHVKFNIEINALWNEKLKHFVLVKLDMQKADCYSVSSAVRRIKAELSETNYLDTDLIHTYRERIGICDRTKSLCLSAFREFLLFINEGNVREYVDVINGVPQNYTTRTRDLPCYQSILLFDYIINDFLQRTDVEERTRYYPVLIWWRLSSIIPLRPSEVYQLPKDCIYEKNGKYFIHIERNKNNFGRKKYSSLIIKDFEIREDVYSIIRDYTDYISEFDDTKYLFSIESLKRTAGLRAKDEDVKRITHITMQTIYKHFKKEIIEQEYGYHMVPLGQKKSENDIEEIKMGDVRHLAIINLMMMGYNPLYIMELAGHHKLNTQIGYYNHVDTFATAKSHVLKEMMKKAENNLNFKDYGSGDYVLQKKLLGASYYDLPLVFDGKGRCRSKNFPYECVYTECIFCPHFIPDRNLSRESYDALKEENEKDLETLQMELKLLMGDYTDSRKFEKVGKEIGVTLNKKILINAYQHIREEKE